MGFFTDVILHVKCVFEPLVACLYTTLTFRTNANSEENFTRKSIFPSWKQTNKTECYYIFFWELNRKCFFISWSPGSGKINLILKFKPLNLSWSSFKFRIFLPSYCLKNKQRITQKNVNSLGKRRCTGNTTVGFSEL